MKRFFCIVVLTSILIMTGCKQKTNQISQQPIIPKDTTPTEFTPPSDSLISVEQLKSWVSCNMHLDSLTSIYTDSFKTAAPNERLHHQETFSAAQNSICVTNGLAGGYKEYKWILQNIGNPGNKQVLDAAGLDSQKNH